MSEPERKRRGPITLFCESRRFRWTIFAAVLMPVLYVLSFGPACWITGQMGIRGDMIPRLYAPALRLLNHGPRGSIQWYAGLAAPQGWILRPCTKTWQTSDGTIWHEPCLRWSDEKVAADPAQVNRVYEQSRDSNR